MVTKRLMKGRVRKVKFLIFPFSARADDVDTVTL